MRKKVAENNPDILLSKIAFSEDSKNKYAIFF